MYAIDTPECVCGFEDRVELCKYRENKTTHEKREAISYLCWKVRIGLAIDLSLSCRSARVASARRGPVTMLFVWHLPRHIVVAWCR